MCKCDRFYFVWAQPVRVLQLGFLKSIRVYSAVCMDCGFVAPSVDAEGLNALWKKAESEGMQFTEKPRKQELGEV
jgi:hypothetical protein